MDANEQRALPELPRPEIVDPGRYGIAYTAEQMREYAIAALAQQVPADGEVKAWLIRADNGMAIKCVMSEQERDALLFRGESSQFPEWTATPLVEAATPQAPQPVVGCDTCGPSGVMAANGTGPYDCYVCGKSATQPQQEAVAEVKWAGPIPQKVLDWPRGLVPFINGAAIGTKLYAHPPTIGQQAVDGFTLREITQALTQHYKDTTGDDRHVPATMSAFETVKALVQIIETQRLAAHGKGG